jgi:hypothetical protein
MYRAGPLMTEARDLAMYKLDFVGAQEVRWDKGGILRVGDFTFFYGKVNKNLQPETVFFTPQNIISS